jgi:site-specific DNA-adenine methylase
MDGYIGGKEAVDPFAGKGDMLSWAKEKGASSYIGFDIDNKLVDDTIVFKNDSLVSIPNSKFIITNPPYLAKNKMSKTEKRKIKNEYEDLYLLSLKRIIESDCREGIVIVPINFFSADNSNALRREFLGKYEIDKINYFTEQVFDDTTYNVVSFHFIKGLRNATIRTLNISVFHDKNTVEKLSFETSREFDYKIGGKEISEIFAAPNVLRIRRLTEATVAENRAKLIGDGSKFNIDVFFNDFKTKTTRKVNAALRDQIVQNIIVINCIDGKSNDSKICAVDIRDYGRMALVGKVSSRNIAHILLENVAPDENGRILTISIDSQKQLISMFNTQLNELRAQYASLFLTNFRDNNRKRISFEFCYALLNYCYCKLLKQRAESESFRSLTEKIVSEASVCVEEPAGASRSPERLRRG